MRKSLSLLAIFVMAFAALFTLQSCSTKNPVPEFCQMYLDESNGKPWSEQKIKETFGDESFREYVLTDADKQEVIKTVTDEFNKKIDEDIQKTNGDNVDAATQAEIDKHVAQRKQESLKTFTAQINGCRTFGDLLKAVGDMDI